MQLLQGKKERLAGRDVCGQCTIERVCVGMVVVTLPLGNSSSLRRAFLFRMAAVKGSP